MLFAVELKFSLHALLFPELQTPYFVTITLVKMAEVVKSFTSALNAIVLKDLREKLAKVGNLR